MNISRKKMPPLSIELEIPEVINNENNGQILISKAKVSTASHLNFLFVNRENSTNGSNTIKNVLKGDNAKNPTEKLNCLGINIVNNKVFNISKRELFND